MSQLAYVSSARAVAALPRPDTAVDGRYAYLFRRDGTEVHRGGHLKPLTRSRGQASGAASHHNQSTSAAASIVPTYLPTYLPTWVWS